MNKILLLFFIFLIFPKCSEVDEFKGVPFRQYADRVIDFSTQYTAGNWSANQALGKENVYPVYDDDIRAWSPSTANGQREYLVLGFDTLQTIHTIEIYETWYPGAVDTVSIRNAGTQQWEKVYAKPAVTNLPEEARIFSIYLRETTYLIDAIRLALNCPAVDGWNEIDAVAITGQRKNDP
ncbi:MAG: hypothetical protein KF687_09405 [Cyclobacteriaceae bacterium]|nr:hypothetical protein [Cyclobacteriaceae bacterium]